MNFRNIFRVGYNLIEIIIFQILVFQRELFEHTIFTRMPFSAMFFVVVKTRGIRLANFRQRVHICVVRFLSNIDHKMLENLQQQKCIWKLIQFCEWGHPNSWSKCLCPISVYVRHWPYFWCRYLKQLALIKIQFILDQKVKEDKSACLIYGELWEVCQFLLFSCIDTVVVIHAESCDTVA